MLSQLNGLYVIIFIKEIKVKRRKKKQRIYVPLALIIVVLITTP